MAKCKKSKLVTLETRRDRVKYQRLYGIAAQFLKGIDLRIYFPDRPLVQGLRVHGPLPGMAGYQTDAPNNIGSKKILFPFLCFELSY
jgi:hypothetical protein